MHEPARPRKTVASQNPASSGAHPLAFAALILANVMLGFGPWFVRLSDTGPVASAFWRITIATPLLFVLAFASRRRSAPTGLPIDRPIWLLLALAGVAFAGDLGSWHLGIVKTTLANATLFGNSATLIFPIYGFLIARAWPSRVQGLALLMAAAGGGLLMGRSYALDPRHLLGDLLCVLAGILYALYFICMARVRATMAPLPALTLASVASILPLLLFALALGERLAPHDWTPLIALALISQVLGQGLMIYALGQLSPLVVGIALLVQPLVSATLGWVIYNERLAAPDLFGAALIALALVLVRQGSPANETLASIEAEPS